MTLFWLFIDFEKIGFEETIQDKRQKNAINGEIKVIRKNDTRELKSFLKGKKTIEVIQLYKQRRMQKEE